MPFDPTTPRWRKSTFSNTNGGQCVELATPGPLAVRDSKNPDGPTLVFPQETLAALLTHLR
ncbi:DUF397 domain-containing protein [Actinokineospora pegani]|uniref:DUF397 domain-containing protein n=1 Tax=Actinokineospora pegani TaxID=2654637 RepID=UPI0012E9A33C|nr:DUF397 domain-containing protein [Actinokineospora pegani]